MEFVKLWLVDLLTAPGKVFIYIFFLNIKCKGAGAGAGRDGLTSDCLFFWTHGSWKTLGDCVP